MLINNSRQKLQDNFAHLEENARLERKVHPLELLLIIASIVIMIPYEMAVDARLMLILGSANLFFDLVFVILLFRFFALARQGRLQNFALLTDFLAALPGLMSISFFIMSLASPEGFILGDFLAAGGLSLAALRSTKLLRVLRLARLFRLLRNIKLLRVIAMRSDSTSCENTVGWLGFMVLSLLIIINGLSSGFGPLARMQDEADSRLQELVRELETNPPSTPASLVRSLEGLGMGGQLVYGERSGQRFWAEEYRGLPDAEAEVLADRRFNGLNSTLVEAGGWQVLLVNRQLLEAERIHNILWISGIIVSVLLFSIVATSIIGRNYTDYMNDYRKAILDSYQGIQSNFDLDEERLSHNDRDSFAYAMGLYTLDFLNMLKGMQNLESALEEKDQEIADLNSVISELEREIEAGSPRSDELGSLDPRTAELQAADLKKAASILKKLVERNPSLRDRILASGGFKSFKI